MAGKKSKASVGIKIAWITALLAAAGVVGAAFTTGMFGLLSASKAKEPESEATLRQTATSSGNSSPNTQIGNVGANSTVTVNNGLSEARITEIQHGMELVQKEQDSKLRKLFPDGYFLFTALDRKQIVPLDRPTFDFKVDWSVPSKVEITPDSIIFDGPKLIFTKTNVSNWIYGPNTYALPRKSVGTFAGIDRFLGLIAYCGIMKESSDGFIIVFGLRQASLGIVKELAL